MQLTPPPPPVEGLEEMTRGETATISNSTPKVTHRVTCDFSSLNTLTTTRKYISMPNINDIAAKAKDCYCTTIGLTDYFSQLELDSASKNVFNFYYKEHVMSYNRAPQGC